LSWVRLEDMEPRRVRRLRRGSALVALTLSASLLLAACHGSASPPDQAPSGQATAKGLTVTGQWPLTGEPAGGRAPRHPVMVVKIDNSANSSPQIGLSGADLVTEELVEGGSTRLAVFYYQHTPSLVGPVRSMRATDIGIVKPAKAALVASGGAPPTVRRIRAAGIETFGEGDPGFRRDNGRRAPYNLFVDLSRLAGTVKAAEPAPTYLPFGKADDLPRGTRATGLSARFSGVHTTRWRYVSGRYVDERSFAAAGDRFRPDNLLVLRVRVGDAGYLDPAGHHVPETKLTGTGKALLLHAGRAVKGTWSKSLDSTLTLRTAGGTLPVPPGHTWVELVPAKGGSVTLTR
jgi:Protein of unknown function (DUF3048) N-terminal domain/Protein of unknown function (DUF3048) C-terminal domain